jgi:molybdopterin-guanine dinucleotide biosynthesis protein A
MGRPKAELFLDRVAAAAGTVFDEIFAVERAGGAVRSIPTIFEPPHDDEAPLFGLACALEHAPGRCFVLATDYPLITADDLRMLRTIWERSNASMLVPVWDDIPQVLCAGYARCVLPIVTERIAARRYDIRGLLDEVEVEFVPVAGDHFLNVNTPEELERSS